MDSANRGGWEVAADGELMAGYTYINKFEQKGSHCMFIEIQKGSRCASQAKTVSLALLVPLMIALYM